MTLGEIGHRLSREALGDWRLPLGRTPSWGGCGPQNMIGGLGMQTYRVVHLDRRWGIDTTMVPIADLLGFS
jgi:hypothetical protein